MPKFNILEQEETRKSQTEHDWFNVGVSDVRAEQLEIAYVHIERIRELYASLLAESAPLSLVIVSKMIDEMERLWKRAEQTADVTDFLRLLHRKISFLLYDSEKALKLLRDEEGETDPENPVIISRTRRHRYLREIDSDINHSLNED